MNARAQLDSKNQPSFPGSLRCQACPVMRLIPRSVDDEAEALEKSLPISGGALGLGLVKFFFLLSTDYTASRPAGLCFIHSLPLRGHHGDSHVRDKETRLRMLSNLFKVSWL